MSTKLIQDEKVVLAPKRLAINEVGDYQYNSILLEESFKFLGSLMKAIEEQLRQFSQSLMHIKFR